MTDRPSRREALQRIGIASAVLSGTALVSTFAFDQGGLELTRPTGERQVRDFRSKAGGPPPTFAIAKSSTDPATLVQRAVDALDVLRARGVGRLVLREARQFK